MAGGSLLKPDPATLCQPRTTLNLKGCLMGDGEVTDVEAWQGQQGRRQRLRGALGSDLEHGSIVTKVFMANLFSELLLLE